MFRVEGLAFAGIIGFSSNNLNGYFDGPGIGGGCGFDFNGYNWRGV